MFFNFLKHILLSVGDTKNRRPSNMFGPKKTPSQSPYMKLLNRALSKSENSREGSQGKVKNYKGKCIS